MGGDKQVTTMVLKVDLQCHRCYKKIKKILCKFPQIQDQVYDEKANTVTIKVVCCSPEKIKEKIKCQGGDSVKGIEIKIPEKPKPKELEKPKEPPAKPKEPPAKPKEPEKTIDPPPKPKDPPPMPKDPEKPKPAPPPPAPAPAPVPVPVPVPVPAPAPVPVVPGYPPAGAYPFRSCCPDCYDGRPGGPCFYGCVPPGPPPCYQYDGYSGRPVYDSYGGGRSYYENSTGACAIM